MSFTTRTSRFLSTRPTVERTHNQLIITPSAIVRRLFGGLDRSRVVIDTHRQTILVEKGFGPLGQSSETIAFNEVSHLDYGFEETATRWAWGRTLDTVETYRIGLVLKKYRRVPLVRFTGEGSRMTGAVGVFLGDSSIDYQGSQGSDSRELIDIIRELTGFPLTPPLEPVTDDDGCLSRCDACNRTNSPFAQKCLYCGGPIVREKECS